MRTLTLTRRAAALALVSTLSLAGCGGSDGGSDDASKADGSSKTSSAPDVTPADGDTLTAEGFTVTVPKGWKESTSSLPGALALAVDSGDQDGFSDNVNVIPDDTVVGVDRDTLEKSVEKVLTGVKATDVTVKDPVTIDGEEAVHVGAVFEQNGVKYRTEQYAVDHADKGYVVTFSFSTSVSVSDRDKLADSVLATWSWAS